MRRLVPKLVATVLAAGGMVLLQWVPERWRLRLVWWILVALAIIWLAGWVSDRYVVRANPTESRRLMLAVGWGLLISSLLVDLLIVVRH